MQEEFWQERWRSNRIAFHEAEPHPFLKDHIARLGMAPGDTILVPLCGKTFDIDWLLAQGFKVIGAEFNRGAVEEVFERLGLEPAHASVGLLDRLQAGDLTIFVGDFFAVGSEEAGRAKAVFDRGALVALPDEMRARYARHLVALASAAPQLVIHYDYDQTQTEGPPFSVPLSSVQKLYANDYTAAQLESRAICGPLAQRCSGEEIATLLMPR